jgi:hypothetical protein
MRRAQAARDQAEFEKYFQANRSRFVHLCWADRSRGVLDQHGDLQCGEKRIAGRNAEESPVMPPTSVVSLHEILVSQGYKLIDDE